ncbi:hypothetical protein PHIM7_239 [Sinorhizobium phage phiM7]|uniref:Uncharacterized protein n=1 Tax=Sinorhizobium phage phiM7 TaxID=1647403 RepID=A0A0F6WBP0_9CAUD|nr:hypothetical protein FDH46_gp239 [Sinorhizobium phage phiM7]AKF12784.1 hypothetical protein PHIM7_239 [Sinorhizobium phage phiM7]AKF13145.1 hypothetical protein PHIM19_240 [Sinorhizobium phage phiM19]
MTELIEEIARAHASIAGMEWLFDECKLNPEMDESLTYYSRYITEAQELVRRCPSIAKAMSMLQSGTTI